MKSSMCVVSLVFLCSGALAGSKNTLEVEDFSIPLDGSEAFCRIYARSEQAFDAFSFGLRFDATKLAFERLELGEALSAGGESDACFSRELETPGEVVVGCVTSAGPEARQLDGAERHHVATLVLHALPGVVEGDVILVDFESDLGEPPVENLLASSGDEISVTTAGG
ncbi:MAG: hypothetical protein AAF517_26070, partial [Planctomycetota bacterium]